jgi:predicted metal-dependent peptidase
MSKYDMPESLQAGRVRCVEDRPYLASILYRLVPIAKSGLGTMGVDKHGRLYFDPDCVWDVHETATVLYHETCHLLRDHAGRCEAHGIGPENAMAWNVAADAEINDDIETEGSAKWPFPPVTPKAMNQKDGLFAEEYYASIPQKPISMIGAGHKSGRPQAGNGKCGGASGSPQEWEEGAPPQAGGGKDAEPGWTEAEGDAIRHKVAQDVREHVRSRGTVPEHLQRWAETILNPKVDWRKVLRSAIRHAMADIAGMGNFTYQRPSRRASCVPKIVLPSLRQPIPNIALVLDTSGSMGDDELADVLSEVAGVLKQCGQKDGVQAIVCDAAIHSARRVFRAEQISLKGGGGTDMRLGLQAALERPVKPHAIIILTDGYTPWPDIEPHGVKVIAALCGKNPATNGIPTWIRVVRISDE